MVDEGGRFVDDVFVSCAGRVGVGFDAGSVGRRAPFASRLLLSHVPRLDCVTRFGPRPFFGTGNAS